MKTVHQKKEGKRVATTDGGWGFGPRGKGGILGGKLPRINTLELFEGYREFNRKGGGGFSGEIGIGEKRDIRGRIVDYYENVMTDIAKTVRELGLGFSPFGNRGTSGIRDLQNRRRGK